MSKFGEAAAVTFGAHRRMWEALNTWQSTTVFNDVEQSVYENALQVADMTINDVSPYADE